VVTTATTKTGLGFICDSIKKASIVIFTARRTLCVRAVFAVTRCPSVHPSVCPSVTLMHCIQTTKDIVKLLFRSGSPITSFLTPAPVPNSKENSFSGVTKYKRGGKILRFSTEIAVYLGNGTRWAHSCYGTLIEIHMRCIEWWHLTSNWCQWSWQTANPVFKVTAYLTSNISNTLGTKLLQKLIGNHTVQSIEWYHMTMSDPWPGFQGRYIFRRWISQKRHESLLQ